MIRVYRGAMLIACFHCIFAVAAQEAPAAPGPAVTPPDAAATEPKAAPPEPAIPDPEAEAKRLAAEAEERKRKEQADKEVAEAARRKAEEEKSFLTKLAENSKLYTGIGGALGLGLNSIHGAGVGFGMTVDYLAYKSYGLHFGVSTGEYATKAGTLSGGSKAYTIAANSSFGFLAFDFAAVYAWPRLWVFEPAVGLGVSLYQLRASNNNFNRHLAPLVYLGLYYNVLSHLQVGFITKLTLATASEIQSSTQNLALDNSAALTTLSFMLSIRYAWF